jgi:gamma-glutamylcyclotransferase (GGCT)/AIG2-like uncharacterized protein YtfP
MLGCSDRAFLECAAAPAVNRGCLAAAPRRPFFFYGTLMDGDVLAAVAGGVTRRLPRRPAIALGYQRVYRAGASYPVLVAKAGGRVDGVLVSGLAPFAAACLARFEGDEYELAGLPVVAEGRTVAVSAFLARPWVPASGREWTLAAWRRQHKRAFLSRLPRTGKPA